jgi:DNA-binding NtrC family response regulator
MQPKRKILIVDDYLSLVEFLTSTLTQQNYEVLTASTGAGCMEILRAGFVGTVLLDVRLPDSSGLDLLEKIKAENPFIPVIMITAHASLEIAIEATRRGGFDFIPKGNSMTERLEVSLKNAFEHLELKLKVQAYEAGVDSGTLSFDNFLTVSPRMLDILHTLKSVVNSDVSVLIEGESGTGKELIARAIHSNGSRRTKPFIAVNCAGIPETLLETEMFGHEKGAFTGASARRTGRFEAADGGILFLDEVGELPMSLQAKLLRVLQERTFERVGGNTPIPVNVRIISATNRDLQEEVKAGRFREDLFYRLSVFPVRLLPLRQRSEDIPMLAEHFLMKYNKEEGKEIKGFTRSAEDTLKSLRFPGNARELENLVRHAVIVAKSDEITSDDIVATLGSHGISYEPQSTQAIVATGYDNNVYSLEDRLHGVFPTLDSLISMSDLQIAYMNRAIEAADGNITRAAKALGLGRATMYRHKTTNDGTGEGN